MEWRLSRGLRSFRGAADDPGGKGGLKALRIRTQFASRPSSPPFAELSTGPEPRFRTASTLSRPSRLAIRTGGKGEKAVFGRRRGLRHARNLRGLLQYRLLAGSPGPAALLLALQTRTIAFINLMFSAIFRVFNRYTSVPDHRRQQMVTLGKLSQAFRRQYPLILGALLLVVILIVATAAFTAYLKATQINDSSRAAKSLATILADETDRSIQSVSLIIARVAARLESAGVDTPASFDQAASTTEFRAFLHDSVADDGSLDGIYAESAQIPADNGYDARLTLTDIHARDQLSALEHAQPDAIYLSSPFRSRTTGAWQLSLTKRVSAKNGHFL